MCIRIKSKFEFKSTLQLFDPLAEIGNRKLRQQDAVNFHRRSEIVACRSGRLLARFFLNSTAAAGERPSPRSGFLVT